MIKSKLATVLLAGTIFTGGVLTALTWTGGTNLTEAQEIASNLNTKASFILISISNTINRGKTQFIQSYTLFSL